jgi:hypothetical protein
MRGSCSRTIALRQADLGSYVHLRLTQLLLCKPEVTGSIPVRSIVASPYAAFEARA